MRPLPLVLVFLILLGLVPIGSAEWSTSASVPASFRPGREVTFSYTATSSSSLDVSIRWRVTLYTCQDLDGDAWCESTDRDRIDHGAQALIAPPQSTQTLAWRLALALPEGAYHYHFHVACFDHPCIGQPPTGSDNRTGAFELAYTNSWTRVIAAPDATREGANGTIQYHVKSTSLDDRDLTGAARLHSTPNGSREREHEERSFVARASDEVTLTWTGIDFPTHGPTLLRVTDTTGPESLATVRVRGVHLHVRVPHASYAAGSAFSMHLTLEGHGATTDPQPLSGQDISIRISTGTTLIRAALATTDAHGRAYLRHETSHDDAALAWGASANVSWLEHEHDLEAAGHVLLTPMDLASIAEDLTALRNDLDEVQLKGVHLDEIGSRNLWTTTLRATGAVALSILIVLLVVFIAFRV